MRVPVFFISKPPMTNTCNIARVWRVSDDKSAARMKAKELQDELDRLVTEINSV